MGRVPVKPHCTAVPCLLAVSLGLFILTYTVVNTAAENPKSLALPVFTDVTSQAGLTMQLVNGDATTEYLLDVNGTGACFLDYNNDGFQDIFLVNGTSRSAEATNLRPHDYLLRNDGDGTFTDVTAGAPGKFRMAQRLRCGGL